MAPISIRPAVESDKATIANLIQLYLYDMTEFMPFPVEPDGRFAYDFFDRFWRFPYLLRAGEEIAGFAFVIEECPLTGRSPCWFMAEFFVLKAYRRQGLGYAAVRHILRQHSGVWHIAVPHANLVAQKFWGAALEGVKPDVSNIAFDGDDWRLHRFLA